MSQTIELPWPPSVNRIWRNVNGRVLLSREGRAHRKLVAQYVMLQRVLPYSQHDRLKATIIVHPPDNIRRDLDNLAKATLDGLQHAGVFPDDSQIDDLHIIRRKLSKGGAYFATSRSWQPMTTRQAEKFLWQ